MQAAFLVLLTKIGNDLHCTHPLTCRFRLLAITATLLCHSPLTAYGHGSFSCGPNALTYSVGSSEGIRCVMLQDPIKAINDNSDNREVDFVFYGEGRWGSLTYRHVGTALRASYGHGFADPFLGSLADIPGNGAVAANAFHNNLLFVVAPGWYTIRVEGALSETWTLVTQALDYHPLPEAKECGPYFSQFQVTSLSGAVGSGLRCVMRHVPDHATVPWLGSGEWGGRKYRHLGAARDLKVQGRIPQGGSGVASDLCFDSLLICNAKALSLTLSPQFYPTFVFLPPPSPSDRYRLFLGFNVTGSGWNEAWRQGGLVPIDLH